MYCQNCDTKLNEEVEICPYCHKPTRKPEHHMPIIASIISFVGGCALAFFLLPLLGNVHPFIGLLCMYSSVIVTGICGYDIGWTLGKESSKKMTAILACSISAAIWLLIIQFIFVSGQAFNWNLQYSSLVILIPFGVGLRQLILRLF